jgi:tetrahydromethanopterin S-methyltransferase subunit G
MKKQLIDMDATNEIFRRMDGLEKRVADLTKEVRALKEKPKITRTNVTPKKK